jgi:hypothetical protein
VGYIRHNTIVVTSWNEKLLEEAAAYALSLGLQVLGPSDLAMNRYRTLCIAPDGSKEGWATSDNADDHRRLFREWLRAQTYGDGSTALEWFEAAYGNDDETVATVTSAWAGEP